LSYLKISGGCVYDPANGVDGEIRDIWICEGKVVTPPDIEFAVTTVNADGMVIMPGAVDMHCHIAGPKVNSARKLQPEMTRQAIADGKMAAVPDIVTTGLRYSGLGYTTCFDAAISPLAARHVHHEFSQLPNVDSGFFVLVGNNHYVMQCVARQDDEGLQSFLAWLLRRSGGFAPKLVNPGGVELWKQKHDGNARDLDQTIDGFNVTPRQIIAAVTRAANALNLPHPAHIHCNNLGLPGNWETTLATLKTVAGHRAHLTHIQFHSYGGDVSDESKLCSRVAPLAEFINAQDAITVDVGQVMFGRTTSMTGDGPLGYYLQQISGEKWYSSDTELESGCGVSPIEYRDKNFINALQWAIGLEWYLLVDDPWKVVMSTDHPNGGSFLAYPQIVRLLMDRAFRAEKLAEVNQKILRQCSLADLTREYTLGEIAIITRAGPARILGLKNKGHLGIGADADITIYSPEENHEQMFSVPRWVFKNGRAIVDDYEVRDIVQGQTLSIAPDYDAGQDPGIERWFNRNYSINAKHYGIGDGEFARVKVLDC
jgi:formylmethanofuran dehydrogenase subunit A